jgi:hypothetical protein
MTLNFKVDKEPCCIRGLCVAGLGDRFMSEVAMIYAIWDPPIDLQTTCEISNSNRHGSD